jgi:RNA polymerase sigma-70 factor (ECF subfamily)
MQPTSLSLLQRVQGQPDAESWSRLVGLYRPLIHAWLSRYRVQASDADDLAQEVLAVVVRELPHFKHSGQPGSFRAWLRSIAANRMRSFWRAGRCRPAATGDSDFAQMLEQIEDPESPLSRVWDRQHDEHVLARLLELMEQEFEPATVKAFRRTALDAARAEDVAAELGMSTAAVYIARSRVLRRLRQEAQGLID